MAAPAPPATPPNQTIYINNLNEKVKREELKKALTAMFSQFGPIMDVVAGRSLKVRGQAWIVFGDSNAASSAMRQMQGFPFYDKPMRIQFAKSKSDAVAKLDGTFVKRERPEKPQKTKKAAKKAEAREAADRARGNAGRSPRPGVSSLTGEPANKILFVQNLPDQTNDMMLSMLFQQFPGFREVRLVPGKSGIAFVEFDTEAQATIAMNGLQNFKITPTNHMHVSYAKK